MQFINATVTFLKHPLQNYILSLIIGAADDDTDSDSSGPENEEAFMKNTENNSSGKIQEDSGKSCSSELLPTKNETSLIEDKVEEKLNNTVIFLYIN